MDRYDIPHKNPPLDALDRWRTSIFALNAARRFRYTAKTDKIRQAREKVKKDIKVVLIATEAAFRFLGHKFSIGAEQLEYLQGEFDLYKNLGGIEGIATKLNVSSLERGIDGTEEDIELRCKIFGINKYDEKPPRGFWTFVWEAFQDVTLIILVICALISLAVGIPTEGISEGWYDGAGILLSVIVVVLVTAASDYRQSLQFQDLENEKKKIKVEVIRAGQRQTVWIYDLVVGDVVILSTGDQVPADGIFISGYSLTIDQSSLTGESEPIHSSKEKPFLLSGSMVQSGSGQMLVTAVGMRTEWGKLMSKLSEGGNNETPLQVRLNAVATTVGKIGLGFSVLTFIVLLLRFFIPIIVKGLQWKMEYLLEIVDDFAIAVTILVVAVPEGLPLAVTLSLAYAMKQMMKDKALVRNLAACETMGSATCICSDKTGTLTTNHMTVVKVCCGKFVGDSEEAKANVSGNALQLLTEGIFFNTSSDIVENAGHHEIHGSPTESAILELGLLLGANMQEIRSRCQIVQVEPFSSEKKRMSVLLKVKDGLYRTHCKGASEVVLGMCDYRLDGQGASVPLSFKDVEELRQVIQRFAQEALRTLCLAYKDMETVSENSEELPKTGLTFLAIVGIKDPVRPGVKEAIKLCFKAGIKVRMVTGDNKDTARAIAHECNLLTEGGLVVEGPEFRRWSHAEMMEKIPKIQVIARSSPKDKLTLVEHLKQQQEVVAVTGDGTNDAPALHEADIGLAMGIAGTEVAKSSADVIILDDNFTTIVNVGKWGRAVYTNIQKFVQFQLTVNIVALVMNFVSACVTGDAPLTAVQLLWVNLIMDTLGALALATEPPYDALMERPPVGRKGNFIINAMWRNIIGQGIYQLVVLWVLEFRGEQLLQLSGDDAEDVRNTMIFNAFVFLQVFNEINSREMEKLNVFSNFFTNKVFLSIILFTVIVQVIIVEFLGRLTDTVPLTVEQWAICIALGALSLVVGAAVKLIRVPEKPFVAYFYRFRSSQTDGSEYHPLEGPK